MDANSLTISRREKESSTAFKAFQDYVGMGPMRSLSKLLALYEASTKRPPTKSMQTLKSWSDKNEWQARLKVILTELEKLEAEQIRDRLLAIREQDYREGATLRKVAVEAWEAEAPNFYRTTRKVIPGTPQVVDSLGQVISPGTPAREIIQVRLAVSDLIRAIRNGSDIQHRAIPQTTEISDEGGGKIIITERVIIPTEPPDLSELAGDDQPDEADDGDTGTIPD